LANKRKLIFFYQATIGRESLINGNTPEIVRWESPSRSGTLNRCVAADTHECSPWTPPSTCDDIVRFSNFSSPEYIIDLFTSKL